MSRIVELPSGATATLKDPDDVTWADREDVLSYFEGDLGNAIANGGRPKLGGGMLVRFQRALITIAVESWTCVDRQGIALPIPKVDGKVLRSLSARDGAKLYDEARGLKDLVFPDFGVSPEAGTPTGSSDDSATR